LGVDRAASPVPVIRIHGLAVDDRPGSDPEPAEGADLRWIRRAEAPVSAIVETTICAEQRGDGAWTHYYFADGEATRVHFLISPDGRLIESIAAPEISEETLVDLLSETVMRSVFRHRGLASFHAAVLARDGRAIALIGARKAGKSTLSAALSVNGWRLVADDLARFGMEDGRWLAFPGMTRSKLHDDVAAVLELPADRLRRRWMPLGARPIPGPIDKLIYAADAHNGGAVPLAAIYVLTGRSRELTTPLVAPIPPAQRIGHLLRHVTRDALYPRAAPSSEAAVTALRLLGGVEVFKVTMPDDLPGLRRTAAAFSAIA
jgi:hypothetical protein